MGVQISTVDCNKHLSIREAARRLLRYEIKKFVASENGRDEKKIVKKTKT